MQRAPYDERAEQQAAEVQRDLTAYHAFVDKHGSLRRWSGAACRRTPSPCRQHRASTQ
jgi:hypothetical protein